MLETGDLASWFVAPTLDGNQNFMFDTAAGRPTLLLFLGSAAWGSNAQALSLLARYRPLFDDAKASFFGVSIDPGDAEKKRIAKTLPGIRWFLDYDVAVSKLYGAAGEVEGRKVYFSHWLLLDPAFRVVMRAPLGEGASVFARLTEMRDRIADLPPAPVLVAPNILEPDLCRELIATYERHGGGESGFMTVVDGITVGKVDHSQKRRRDMIFEDEALRARVGTRLKARLLPQIERVFQFTVTRIERWNVACYDGADGGFFFPHRDNTTAGTAHRRFACTINLNAEEYSGGDLRFPEFNPRTYRAPTGGAVVFSCSLLHEALPVTSGKRYAFLPFFYDDAAALQREKNLHAVAPELRGYRATVPSSVGAESED